MKKNNNSLLNSLPLQGKEATFFAFTLVELIVVITILAILGTIAFISLQGYSQDSRDAVRISDVSRIKTSVELFQLGSGKYPLPTDIIEITYSGTLAWSQGLFGEDTFKNVTNLDKIPLDPSTDKQYVYSVTNTRQEYQIAGIIEGEIAYNQNQPHPSHSNQPHPSPLLRGEGIVQAGEKTAVLRISGTYNGKILKVSTGGTDYVLAIPSIITSTGFTVEQIASNDYFAYNGYKNLPAQYEGGAYKLLGSEGLNLVDGTNILVYSGSVSTLSSTKQDGINGRKLMLENLQSAYAGSQISHVGEISEILSLDTENTDDTEKLSSTIVSNNLGGSVVVSSGGGIGGGTISPNCDDSTKPEDNGNIDYVIGSPTEINQNYTQDSENCGYSCKPGYAGSNCDAILTYQEQGLCNLPDIHIPTSCIEGNAGCYVVAACDVGTNTANTIGEFFQWGNNAGLKLSETSSTRVLETTSDSTYNNNIFTIYSGDWTSIENNDLWGDHGGGGTDEQRKGPCPTNYHVPTKSEWIDLVSKGGWSLNGGSLARNSLNISITGKRNGDTGDTSLINSRYWSSTPGGIGASYFFIHKDTGGIYFNETRKSYAFSVRCFKN